MSTTRRSLLKGGALAAGALTLGARRPATFAQGKELNVVGATFNLRDPIIQEFTKRTGITVKPWLSPSAQARADRIRVAPVDNLESGADFVKYAWDEKLIQPIDLSRLPNWKRATRLFVEGQATPQSPVGMGDNPGRLMYVDREKTSSTRLPTTPTTSPPRTTCCRGASCSTPSGAARRPSTASTGSACSTPPSACTPSACSRPRTSPTSPRRRSTPLPSFSKRRRRRGTSAPSGRPSASW